MAYEKFNKNKRSIKEQPVITIGSGGVIYLNTFIMRNYFQGITWALLLYDKDIRSLAIKPCKKEEMDSFRLTFSSQQYKSTGVIAARSVLKALNIDYSKKKPYIASWNAKEKILEVKLGK